MGTHKLFKRIPEKTSKEGWLSQTLGIEEQTQWFWRQRLEDMDNEEKEKEDLKKKGRIGEGGCITLHNNGVPKILSTIVPRIFARHKKKLK